MPGCAGLGGYWTASLDELRRLGFSIVRKWWGWLLDIRWLLYASVLRSGSVLLRFRGFVYLQLCLVLGVSFLLFAGWFGREMAVDFWVECKVFIVSDGTVRWLSSKD